MAACDCGSTNSNSPCSGREISVEVGDSRTVGFSWEFNSGGGDAYCGQFANGDYWIAPRGSNSNVTVTRVSGSGSGSISLDENPQLESMGLLGSDGYGNYSAQENILDDLPLSFNRSTSLVAAIQRNESAHGQCGTRAIVGNCAEAYHVVTVLDEVPPNAGSTVLRPSIDETSKELLTLSDFDLSRIPAKSFLNGTSSTGLERIRQKWSHSTEILSLLDSSGRYYSEGGRAFRANLLVDDYAAGVASSWYSDLMTLMSNDNSLAEKQSAVAAMITYGKDLYFSMYDGDQRVRNWGAGAGQHLGKFPAAVLFAALAKDSRYGDNLQKTSSTLLGFADLRGPHELEQVNSGVNGPVWGDFPDEMSTTEVGSYWASLLQSQCFDGATGSCNPNIGKKTQRDPYGYIDGPPNKPGTSYMAVSIGAQRGLVATMFLIPEVCAIVDSPDLVKYVDRVHNHGIQTANDPCAPPDPREDPDSCDAYRSQGCRYYGLSNTGTATWGPDPANPSQCIRNRSGQNGRFPADNGRRLNYQFTSSQVEDSWDQIRGNTSSIDCVVARIMPPSNLRVTPQDD